MAGQSVALANTVLKDAYEGEANEQCNNANVVAAVVQKNKRNFEGAQAVLLLHVSRNTGHGARLENEVLPPAGAQGYRRELIGIHDQYGKISLSGQAIDRITSGRAAFIGILDTEMGSMKTDVSQDMARQYWGTSDGVIVKCGVTTATNVVQLDATTTLQQLVKFAEGAFRVDIGTVATPTSVCANRGVVLGSVDFVAKTFTIDGAPVTTATTDRVFSQGNGGSGANQRESTGLQTIVSDSGTLFNVDSTVTFQWKSTVDNNPTSPGTDRPVSEPLITKVAMRTKSLSGQNVDLMIAEDLTYVAISAVISGRQRIVNDRQLKGGFTGIQFAAAGVDITLTNDKDAPPKTLWGINTSALVEYVQTDWGWMNRDGSILHLRTDGTDGYEANWYSRRELATTDRHSHFRINDLAEA